ncbi:hypothetical protein AB0F91_38460 [Amycolatopsis sp. NPDC023774]|uniref:hypothetical protein n=1 Tax=Amycolatopsis sp. NPDC023774 TaxID=3155015 RepID=UPI0033C98FDE
MPGTVVSAATPPKGTRWIDLSLRAGGRVLTERVDRSSTAACTPGESVTVVFDPADPPRVRTTAEDGLSENGVDFAWIGVSLVLLASWLPRRAPSAGPAAPAPCAARAGTRARPPSSSRPAPAAA